MKIYAIYNCVYVDKAELIYHLTHSFDFSIIKYANADMLHAVIPYGANVRRVVKTGVNFDSTTRTIGEREIEE